jgi:hypothetical protein
LAALAAVLAVIGTGCRLGDPFRTPATNVPVLFESAPSREALIGAMEGNTAQVRQLSCDIQMRIDGVPPLSGTLILEKPRRLRLKAGLIGISDMGIDLGSNDEEFWLWNKSALGGQAPAIYFARYRDFENALARQAIPLEPQWIMDALGLLTLPPAHELHGPTMRPDGRYELRHQSSASDGGITKSLIIDPRTGLVQQQSLYDANQQLIAWANAMHHRYFDEFGVSLPQRVEFFVVGADRRINKISLDMAGHRINQLFGDPTRQWTRPQPNDAQWIDLAQAAPSSVQAP